MRFFIFLIFTCSFVFSDFAVYDFKSSLMRVEHHLIERDDCKTYLTHTKDSLKGILLVEDCSSFDCNNESKGILYVYRAKDKQYKNIVWKSDVALKTVFYGKNFVVCDLVNGYNALNNIRSCNLEMRLSIPEPLNLNESYPNSRFDCLLSYGFLGWANFGNEITFSGFGKADNSSTISFCDDGTYCLRFSVINGDLTGVSNYSSFCGGVGGVDMCLKDYGESTVNGKWSIRLNKTRTALIASTSDIDSLVLSWLKKSDLAIISD